MVYDATLDLFLGSVCAACDRPGRALCLFCESRLPRGGTVRMPTPAPAGLAVVRAAAAYDGPLKAMINAHKEHQRLALARPLGRVLASVVIDVVPHGEIVLVPVPSARAVVRRRGQDPLLRITRQAAAQLRRQGRQAGVAQLLHVVRRAADQTGLDASARHANLRGSMRARSVGVPPGAVGVVLVDDVVTTGATTREAQRALEDAGAHVLGIAAVAATERRTSLPNREKGD